MCFTHRQTHTDCTDSTVLWHRWQINSRRHDVTTSRLALLCFALLWSARLLLWVCSSAPLSLLVCSSAPLLCSVRQLSRLHCRNEIPTSSCMCILRWDCGHSFTRLLVQSSPVNSTTWLLLCKSMRVRLSDSLMSRYTYLCAIFYHLLYLFPLYLILSHFISSTPCTLLTSLRFSLLSSFFSLPSSLTSLFSLSLFSLSTYPDESDCSWDFTKEEVCSH